MTTHVHIEEHKTEICVVEYSSLELNLLEMRWHLYCTLSAMLFFLVTIDANNDGYISFIVLWLSYLTSQFYRLDFTKC